jgi:putative endonuclease
MIKNNKQVIGAIGENAIAEYLTVRGFKILDRNWRTKGGELDLIAKSPAGKVHFVEVKTRNSHAYGHPLEAIDREKAHRLQKLALAWLVMHNHFGADYQIDVAGVTLNKSLQPNIDYRAGVL